MKLIFKPQCFIFREGNSWSWTHHPTFQAKHVRHSSLGRACRAGTPHHCRGAFSWQQRRGKTTCTGAAVSGRAPVMTEWTSPRDIYISPGKYHWTNTKASEPCVGKTNSSCVKNTKTYFKTRVTFIFLQFLSVISIVNDSASSLADDGQPSFYPTGRYMNLETILILIIFWYILIWFSDFSSFVES